MKGIHYDFSGWATKNNLRCADGLTIMQNAFAENDGEKVPLVWNHDHNSPDNVLGHAYLENRDEGVYAYCTFNNNPSALAAKEMIKHGDIDSLSIYANNLQKNGNYVMHGKIREVSVVLAGANPGAYIDEVVMHSENNTSEALVYSGEFIDDLEGGELQHGYIQNDKGGEDDKSKKDNGTSEDTKTVNDIFESMTEEQKKVVYAIVAAAIDEEKSSNNQNNNVKDDETMKHNVFAQKAQEGNNDVLSHSEVQAILADGKRYGSLKDSVLAHGIDNIDYLFPDAKNVAATPELIKRQDTWVTKVLSAVHHTPFSRIKSTYADITTEDARAKGYIKGKMKKEEVFSLLKRTTSPTTIYKKQKLDRDDVVDITDFDVVSWLKAEMRMMLNEEIARALLIGDGRLSSSDDKINEQCIRPIWTDADLYTIKARYNVNGLSEDAAAKQFIRTAIKARKDYKGSGEPVLYTTEDMLTSMMLIEDANGRVIYDTQEKLKSALRVKDIITVPVMENNKRTEESVEYTLDGLIVNLVDYNIGADKGGAVNMFDDFDIDYNQQKYLIETRCSGALIKPYSAIAVERFTQA